MIIFFIPVINAVSKINHLKALSITCRVGR